MYLINTFKILIFLKPGLETAKYNSFLVPCLQINKVIFVSTNLKKNLSIYQQCSGEVAEDILLPFPVIGLVHGYMLLLQIFPYDAVNFIFSLFSALTLPIVIFLI